MAAEGAAAFFSEGSLAYEALSLGVFGLGAVLGLGWVYHEVFPKRSSWRRHHAAAVEPTLPVIFMLQNNSGIDMAMMQSLNVTASIDPADNNATFHYGDGGLADGHLFGYSVCGSYRRLVCSESRRKLYADLILQSNDRGLMSGNLSFHIPGLEQPIAGTWVSINESAISKEAKIDAEVFAWALKEILL